MMIMPKTDRSEDAESGLEEDEKNPPGRPKVLPPDLDKRYQIRCASRDFELWEKHRKKIGFPNLSAWLRKLANDALPANVRRRTGP